jgi:drug/metabolite transporter (DMT)-like permease
MYFGSKPSMPRHQLQGEEMNSSKIVALLLIVAGVLALAYGGFSYTKDTQQAKIGPLELTVKQQQTVNIPVWAGIGAIVIGGALLVLGSRKG